MTVFTVADTSDLPYKVLLFPIGLIASAYECTDMHGRR